jgi:1-deoxy-D-xylulose-5-phosphate synthase
MLSRADPVLLETVNTPAELRCLLPAALPRVAGELRAFLIDTIAQCGGHFAAGLGTVELTVALHYVFNTPIDRLVWDIGHGSYPHKILTGRRDALGTIRQKDGLSAFLKRTESPYDAFGAGHSSTSLSAALGMAIAAAKERRGRKVVAVVGDGGLTAGLAFEALHHAGSLDVDLLAVLNDNGMSISPNVGAIAEYLARIVSGRHYKALADDGATALVPMPDSWAFARDTVRAGAPENPGVLFEALGWRYFGPIDGHDLPALLAMLQRLRGLTGPRLLHVVTRKGKGYAQAEADPVKYHGVSAFKPHVGLAASPSKSAPTYTQVFGDWLCDMAAQDERVVAITPAMREGSGLVTFSEHYPDRYFDVAIAEQHSVTLAAGLASAGLKPVVAIYSSFLQRAYDQAIHDVAVQNLPVLFALDRAGAVGPDGPTHNGSYDFTFLRCLPNFVVMAPADENECRQMLYTGLTLDQPAAVRYPRGAGPGVPVTAQMSALSIGRAEIRRRGSAIALLAFGSMVAPALEAADALNATVVNMRFIKPLDERMILDLASAHTLLVTLEDNVVAGGAGSAVNECLAAHGVQAAILNLGMPDCFLEQGSREDMLVECGLDARSILRRLAPYRRAVRGTTAAEIARSA